MENARAGRIQSIDGLRGIAALLVVLFHLHGAVSRTAKDWLWGPVDWVARYGYLGVDVFFVISGFVIALSVSRALPTLGFFGRFVLRRSIRLDPPYWAAILLEVVLLYLMVRIVPDLPVVFPSGGQVLAHLGYVQDLLGYPNIVDSFWTLCYEVQFYGFFVGLVVLRAALPARLQGPILAMAAAVFLFLVSLYTRYWRPDWVPGGLAIDRWFQFFIGVLTWRAVTAPGRDLALYASWGALAGAVVLAGQPAIQLLAIGVSALLVAISRRPSWGWFFALRPVVFLGLTSYSLYLYHASIGWRFIGLLQRLIPGPWSGPLALAAYLAGIVVCVAVSALLWRFIERPCVQLAQRVKLPLRAA